MINRPAFVIIATVILIAAAILASMRARRLLAEHVVQVDKAYEETIVEILPTDAGTGLLAVEVLQRAVTTNVYFRYLSRGGSLAKSAVPVALGELVTERLLPSLERTEALLAELEKSKMITQVNGRYVRLAPPPKQ